MRTTFVAFRNLLGLIENQALQNISGYATSFVDTFNTFCIGQRGGRRATLLVSEATSIELYGKHYSRSQKFTAMATLRADARRSAAQRQAQQNSRSPAAAVTESESQMGMIAPTATSSTPPSNLVAAIGSGPPLGSQECPMTPPRSPAIPSYTWERTSPVRGRSSGLFVLHLGPTPQTSPMSRDPSNVIVTGKQLKEALRAKVSRGRRGEGGVTRRPEDSTATNSRKRGRPVRAVGSRAAATARKLAASAPPGWEPPHIQSTRRSPIHLRPRDRRMAGSFVVDVPCDLAVDITGVSEAPFVLDAVTLPTSELVQREAISVEVSQDIRFFNPGASPPESLVRAPVHSPSEHAFLDENAFPKRLRVTVRSETLDLDAGLVGDENGVSGVVVSRFYHHVTGTPMFHVDFGGAIGARSVRVHDSTLDVSTAFPDTQRSLFPSNDAPTGDDASPSEGATPSLPAVEEEASSGEDPEWEAEYEDFKDDDAAAATSSDCDVGGYTEDPLQELGLYNEDEDVQNWPFERLFADDQWQDQSVSLMQNTHNFSGPVPGPTSAVGNRPLDYFLRFWPPHILERVVRETNRYACQPSQMNPAVTNGRPDWTPLDSEELLAWFVILMLMGLKEFPHIRCYWDRTPFYNCPVISEAMPRKRFEAIIRCLHLVDNDVLVTDRADPAYDKLAKVRWLCESFAGMSQSLYNNERVLTVDEIMIPYKGRFCNIRQYMKSKPVKFGVKVWALANSESRYVSNIIVYLGADEARTEGDSVGEDAVLTAIAGLEGRGHVIVTDNFFTSPRLFMALMERGFWATGTCRKTRKGFPASLAGFANTDLPERGHLVLKMHRSRKIAAICWMDAKPVFLLSTACNPIGEDSYAGRWVGRERVEFPTSPILLQYQAGMRGVDLVDQQRQEYSTQLHSHKWWHRIFMFVLDSSLLNAYILYAFDRRALGVPVHSRLLWHYGVATDLLRHRMGGGHVRGPLRNLAAGGLHFSSGHPQLRRRCVVCFRRTRRLCPGCGGLFQCEGQCFRAVHTQHAYRPNMRAASA